MKMRFTNLAWQRDGTLNADEISLLCQCGLVDLAEASAVLEKLRLEGAFRDPMDAARRTLLAALIRAAELRPRLVVANR